MHDAVRAWVKEYARGHYDTVCEVGSRDINGTIRDLIDCDRYLGVDLYAGPGVDLVADARTVTDQFDLVLCCEVLEHEPDAFGLIETLGRLAKPYGLVIATAAGIGRGPHSAIDGLGIKPGEHYCNLDERHFIVEWGCVLTCEIRDFDWRVVWRRT